MKIKDKIENFVYYSWKLLKKSLSENAGNEKVNGCMRS